MIMKHKFIHKILLTGVAVAGILSIAVPQIASAEIDGKFEWVDKATIRVTYNKETDDGPTETTADLKFEAPHYVAKGLVSEENRGGVTGMAVISSCRYDVSVLPTGNKAQAQVTSNLVSGGGSCSDTMFAQSISVASPDNADKDPAAAADGEGATSCQIDGIGWLICPVMNFMALITDGAQYLVTKMLEMSPLNVAVEDNPTYEAWSMMRGFANIVFVGAFLFIIFSQLTSIGIGNYGIKKLLPRLVIAGILVNVSYWICAIALDLSNILGSSVFAMFKEVTEGFAPGSTGTWSGGGDRFATLVGGILGGSIVIGGIAAIGVTVLIPLLITALAAIVTVVIVLTIRQALIVILIVISPLAFVAFLLPNTEGYFSKWKSLFITMLIMYPVVALIFGGSALASEIIMFANKGENGDVLVQIVGAFVAIIPLFITPIVMKTAGGLLNRIGGIVNNTDKGVFDRMRKGASGLRERELASKQGNRFRRGTNIMEGSKGNSKVLGGAYSRRRKMAAFVAGAGTNAATDRKNKDNRIKSAHEQDTQEYFAKRAIADEDYANSMLVGATPGTLAAQSQKANLQASAEAQVDKMDQEDIKSRIVLMQKQNDPSELLNKAQEELTRAAEDGDTIGAQASLNILLTQGGSQGIEKAHQALTALESAAGGYEMLHDTTKGSMGSIVRSAVNSAGLKGKDAALNQWSYDQPEYEKDTNGNFKLDASGEKILVRGPRTISDLATNVNTFKGLSDQELVGQTTGALQRAQNVITPEQAQAVLVNQSVQGGMSTDKRNVFATAASKANGGPASTAGTSTTTPSAPSSAPSAQPQQPPQQQTSTPTNQNMPPGTSNYVQSASGLYVPHGTPASPQAAPTVNAQTAPQAQAQTQQYPQQQQQQQQYANVAPAMNTPTAQPSGIQNVYNNTTTNTQGPPPPAATNTAPVAPTIIPGGGGTTNIVNNAGPTNIANSVRQQYDTAITQAGGDISKMDNKTIGELITKSHGDSGSQDIHDRLRQEFGKRRGFDGEAGPMPPSNPPNA